MGRILILKLILELFFIKKGFILLNSFDNEILELGKLCSSYPNYENDFEYPKDSEEKIKKSLKDIEKAEVL